MEKLGIDKFEELRSYLLAAVELLVEYEQVSLAQQVAYVLQEVSEAELVAIREVVFGGAGQETAQSVQ